MDPTDPNQYEFPLDQFGVEMPPGMNPYANIPHSPHNDNYNMDQPPYPPYTNTSSSSTTAASTSTTVGSKRRKKTSGVWKYYVEEEFVDAAGVTKNRARCLHPGCNSFFSMQKGGGNGHMARHIKSHAREDEQSAAIQSRIQFNPDGSQGIFMYDQTRQRDALARLIASNDLSLGFGESAAFVKYIRTAHTPTYKAVSRQTTTRDMKKIAKEGLAAIKEELGSSTFSVSITSDIWNGLAKQDYITVVAHYVSSSWDLNKRVIGFELIDSAHTGENIADAILKVVSDFGLCNKIFAVTMDNASANSSAMNILTPTFEVYVISLILLLKLL